MVFKILLFAFIGMMSCGVHAGSLDKPYTFSDTQLLSASKVNSNFQALSLGITELESRLIPLDAGTRTWSGIPYTFVGGARALASEIRSNYSTAASGVQALRDRVQALDSISGSWDGVPHTITAGQSATQTVLNENFDALFTALNILQDRVATFEQPVNRPPTASFTVSHASGGTGTSFLLDASGSSDPDGDSLAYAWREHAENPATDVLSDTTAVKPTFTPQTTGTYGFTLVVGDGDETSEPDEVQVVVTPVGSAEIVGEIEDDTGGAEIIGEIEEETGDAEVVGEIEEDTGDAQINGAVEE